jgi:hypothetical protein
MECFPWQKNFVFHNTFNVKYHDKKRKKNWSKSFQLIKLGAMVFATIRPKLAF